MDKLSSFKQFIKNNPTLIKYIKNGEMTWQKFYEIYDMYGEEQEVWKNYFSSEEPKFEKEQTLDFITWLKKLDLDTIQDWSNRRYFNSKRRRKKLYSKTII